jgi:hypothetical protein
MKTKKTLLAAGLAAFAFMALPALAAANPHLEIEEGGSGHFTLEGGTTQLSTVGEEAVHCESVEGTGEFEGNPSKTGSIEFLLHECESNGFACTSSGQSTGDVAIGPLPFHLVTATRVVGEEEKTVTLEKVDGTLITPNEPDPETGVGQFASLRCAFGLVPVEVRGTGLIGEITEPETGVPSSTLTVNFEELENGSQKFKEVREKEGTYDLEAKFGNGEYETTGLAGETTGTFTEESENTLINTGA